MAALVLCLGGCTVNKATGERQLNAMSESEELSLGAEAEPQFLKQYGGEIPSPSVLAYVRDLGNRLAAASERPGLPWAFHVVDSGVINAFALPGGKVFISRGLLAKMTNEAQLAGVLGHEIGHVTAEHIGQQMTRQAGMQAAIQLIGVAGQVSNNQWMQTLGVGAANTGGTLYLLKFGRDQESQADTLGMRYMSKLGYSPMGQLQVMEILKREAGGGGQLEMLSTHPLPDTRITRIRNILQTDYPGYNDMNRYRLNEAQFKSVVLDALSKLPAPRHKG